MNSVRGIWGYDQKVFVRLYIHYAPRVSVRIVYHICHGEGVGYVVSAKRSRLFIFEYVSLLLHGSALCCI